MREPDRVEGYKSVKGLLIGVVLGGLTFAAATAVLVWWLR